MLVGVDFDNTIVCYDNVFHRLAVQRGLIPVSVPAVKDIIRDRLRQCGREDDWTELQGAVYGAHMEEAAPFPGAWQFLARCARHAIRLCIISHRTRVPVRGPAYDLHRAAYVWLEAHGFSAGERAPLSPAQVHFEPTKARKLVRIRETGCTHFIDDLPEFLADPEFPAGVHRILFNPRGATTDPGMRHVRSWAEVEALVWPMR